MTDRVLLTGATGFVGGAVLAELVSRGLVDRIVLWVRAAAEDAARRRIARSLARFLGEAEADAAAGRTELVLGDLADAAALASPILDGAQLAHESLEVPVTIVL